MRAKKQFKGPPRLKGKNAMKRQDFFLRWDSLMPEDAELAPAVEEGNPCKLGETWRILHSMKDPRTIKTHLHAELLPDAIWTSKAKVISYLPVINSFRKINISDV